MADHGATFLLITILALLVVLLIFGMKYFSAARVARLKITSEGGYRDLAARAVRAEEDNNAALFALKASISEIESRVVRIEKVLKEVE